jgi:mRNA interferase RelE/StbE
LSENPRPSGCKKMKAEKEYLWRIRVSDYHIIYSIKDTIQIVVIRRVGHRKNIYNK